MEVSEEQKRRMKANRAAALARRCAKTQSVIAPVPLHHIGTVVPHQFTGLQLNSNIEGWKKSGGVLSGNHQDLVGQNSLLEKLEVVLEMCAPTKFVLMLVGGLRDHDTFQDCLQKITAVKPCESWDGFLQWPMYNLRDYDLVTQALKGMPGVYYQPIPWPTRMVLEKSLAAGETWVPQRPGHVADTVVENLLQRLPLKLKHSLLPFQWEGVRFGLRRGGRCLLADEMGVGKTIQAIAMAACYKEEGPLLVVCPASMRLVWAEELERWLPFLTPLDVHLVFGRRDEVTEQMQVPKVVVISYFMLRRLQKTMLGHKWGMLIVDESHNLRCTAKKVVSEEISAVLEVAKNVKRAVLLSGTPSISRPFDIFNQVECLWPELLGKSKYEFARNYCEYQSRSVGQGPMFEDFSNGSRLQELNILLKQTIMALMRDREIPLFGQSWLYMYCAPLSGADEVTGEWWPVSKCQIYGKLFFIHLVTDGQKDNIASQVRRMKEEVMGQLPPKRRQVICLKIAPVDIQEARAFTSSTEAQRNSTSSGEEMCNCGFSTKNSCDCAAEIEDDNSEESEVVHDVPQDSSSARSLGNQEIGITKLRGFREWLLNNSIFASCDSSKPLFENTQKKMIIFAHHHKVLDGIQETIQGNSVELVRIDGSTLPQERLKKVNRFQTQPEVQVAIVGVTAGGVGLNFSAAQIVVFLELPKTASEMLQAEDRAHRRGQNNAVNVYIFCAKGTADEQHWQSMSRSLERVSTMTDGTEASFQVEAVLDSSEPCFRVADPNSSHNNEANLSLLSENTVQPFADDTLVIDSIQDHTQDSCITSELATISHSDQNHRNNCKSSETIESTIAKDVAMGASQPSLGALGEDDGEVEQGLSFFDFPATSLMFEVSSNTGRIHLHLKSPDGLSCPIFLQENFKPEDLEHFREKGGCEKGTLPTYLVNSVAHREEATSFIQQWTSLRPLFRKRLLGQPLLLPLSAELSCLKIETQYAPGGIARGGSKRRYTPKEEVGSAPPEGATWKIVFFYKRCGLKASQATQAWSAQGTPLCKYCQHPCEGHRCKKPESFEDLFCKTLCLEEYLKRTNRRYSREELFKLEGGVCVKCHLDCHALVECVRPLPLHQRRSYILVKAPDFVKHKKLLERLVKDPTEGNAWHADHIVAVADGGGECSLENLQTLCVICHSKVTADQRRRRRSEQANAKNGLQKTIRKLLEQPNRSKRIRISSPEADVPAIVVSEGLSDSEDDKELLDVKVAGSAYSISITEVVQEKFNEDLDLKTPAKDQGSMINIKTLFSNDDQSPVSCDSENGREGTIIGIPDAVAKKPVFSLRSLSRFLL